MIFNLGTDNSNNIGDFKKYLRKRQLDVSLISMFVDKI